MKVVIRESYFEPEQVIENVKEVTIYKTRYDMKIKLTLGKEVQEYSYVNIKSIKE